MIGGVQTIYGDIISEEREKVNSDFAEARLHLLLIP